MIKKVVSFSNWLLNGGLALMVFFALSLVLVYALINVFKQ